MSDRGPWKWRLGALLAVAAAWGTTPAQAGQETGMEGGGGQGAEPAVEPQAAPPQPPSGIQVRDQPNDAGEGLEIKWLLSSDDVEGAEPRKVAGYHIYRSTRFTARYGSEFVRKDGSGNGLWKCEPPLKEIKPALSEAQRKSIRDAAAAAGGGATEVEFFGPFILIKDVPYGTSEFQDPNCWRGVGYRYRVTAISPDGAESTATESAEAVVPTMQWFDMYKGWFFIVMVVIGGSVVYFIEAARSGKSLKVRKIAGLQAVEEAVGRATEMGRSCLYIPGIGDMNEIQTIASMTILGRLSKVAAEHDAKVEVPNIRSLVMTTARETVKQAYLAAGRPDAYNEDLIYYVTDEQFGYVAAVSGLMVREKPAACFYLGQFYAESLILAETGNSIGAIQIAGTAMPAQLPFFVAACDYTLIGEEFYAASAYLSGEPHQIGSLKGQDVGKAIVAVLVIVGCVLATLKMDVAVDYLTNQILSTGG